MPRCAQNWLSDKQKHRAHPTAQEFEYEREGLLFGEAKRRDAQAKRVNAQNRLALQ